jgi:predicted DNA-binding transcriptional regulator AlpA
MTKDDNLLIPAKLAREQLLGGISPMTEWRWLRDESMNFPKPIVINGRRYHRPAKLLSWLETRSQETA